MSDPVPPIDRQGIVDLVGRYAHAMDTGDADAAAALFTDDALLRFVSTGMEFQGREAIAEFYRSALASLVGATNASTHLMGNTVVTAERADHAAVTTSAVVYLADGAAASVAIRGLTYRDLVRRDDHGWRFAEREHRLHWEATVPGGPKIVDVPVLPIPAPSSGLSPDGLA